MNKKLNVLISGILALGIAVGCGGGEKKAPASTTASAPKDKTTQTQKATVVKAKPSKIVEFGKVRAAAQTIVGTDIKYNTKVFIAGGGNKLYVSRDLKNSDTGGTISAFTLKDGAATLDKTVGKDGNIKLESSSIGTIAASPNGSLIYLDDGFKILKNGQPTDADGPELKKNKKLVFFLENVLVSTGKLNEDIIGSNKDGGLTFVMGYSKDKALSGIVQNDKVTTTGELSDFPVKLKNNLFKGGLYEFAVDNGEDFYASGKLASDGNVIIAALGGDSAKIIYDAKLPAIQTWALTNKYVVASDGPINFYLWDKATGDFLGKVSNKDICGGEAGRVLQMYANGKTIYCVYLAEKDKAPGKDVPVSIHTLKF